MENTSRITVVCYLYGYDGLTQFWVGGPPTLFIILQMYVIIHVLEYAFFFFYTNVNYIPTLYVTHMYTYITCNNITLL